MSETPPTPDPVPTPDPAPMPDPVPTPAPMMGGGMGPSQEEKTQAMLSWLLSIICWFIAPLIFFFISGNKPFVKRHAAMCLGLHILNFAIVAVLVATLVGARLSNLVGLVTLVFVIMGAIAANKGEAFDVPGVGPIIANIFKV